MDYWTDEIPQPDGKKLKRHLQFIKLGPDKVRHSAKVRMMAARPGLWSMTSRYNRKK